MYNEEHPLEVALAALVAGLAFTIFLYAKLGVFNPDRKDVTEIIYNTGYELLDTETDKP